MIVKISNATVNIKTDSLDINDSIGERSTCSFNFFNNKHYSQGQQVEVLSGMWVDLEIWVDAEVWVDDETVFAGFIEVASERKVGPTILHEITCKDMHYLSDKRIIAESYANKTCGYIVADIITKKLAAEGVLGNPDPAIDPMPIQDGPTIEEAVFNYCSCTKALDALAEKANYVWYIDFDKQLYFYPRSQYAAPFSVTGADTKEGRTHLANSNTLYRNTQYVKGGKDITDPLTEHKIGDGATRAWPLSFPIAKVPTITLNSVAVTVGIRGLETGKDFYWSKGDNTISQDLGSTVLESTDDLAITYQGEFDVVVKSLNETEILSRLTTEGTTGIVEDVADEPNSTSRTAAFEVANSKLAKYGLTGRQLKFRTHKSGLKAGQILTVTLPEHNLNATEMLIESIGISTQEDAIIWYDVACVEGPEKQSWTKLFERMATREGTFVIRENIKEDEVLITLKTFSKTWLETTPENIFKKVYPGAGLYPGVGLYPSFEETDRVLYMELLDASDNVLIRKAITKKTLGEGSINSLTYISPFDFVGSVAKARWYGGSQATSANGTGVLIDERVWVEDKTAQEALQIDKTDIKGWL